MLTFRFPKEIIVWPAPDTWVVDRNQPVHDEMALGSEAKEQSARQLNCSAAHRRDTPQLAILCGSSRANKVPLSNFQDFGCCNYHECQLRRAATQHRMAIL